jgi:hypothetical protein
VNLPPIPPAELLIDLARQDVLPAAGAAAFVFAVGMAFGRWSVSLAAAAAIIAAFVLANFQPLEHGESLTWETTHRLLPWKPNKSTFTHLPRAVLLLVAVGLASRWIGLLVGRALKDRLWWLPSLVVWLPRWVAVLVVGAWVAPPQLLEANIWLKPALAAATLLVWIATDGPARSGSGDQTMALVAACFLAGSVVFIYAHSKRFMELATLFGFGFAGIAAVARVSKADTSGAVPAAAGLWPALALNVWFQTQTDSLIPVSAYWLLALAPLGMLPFLHPRLARQNPWLVGTLRALAVLIPLAIAVVMALQFEQLPPEADW